MKTFEAVIVGAGLAGLQCAKALSAQGARVLLVDRKTDLTLGIHTTGIFVRKTFEDFALPADCLGKSIRQVMLYSPSNRALRLTSDHDEFRLGKMAKLYNAFLQDCEQNKVEWTPATRYLGVDTSGAETLVKFETAGKSWTAKTRCLVGADGAQSKVARDLGLDENREWIVGFEEVWQGVPLIGEPQLHCFLDSRLAPGYLAWVTSDGEETHIGVGGYAARFNPRRALEQFRAKVRNMIIDLSQAQCVETRGGCIPVNGVLRRIANKRGLLIGDAAGAVSPLTAGGLDPCLRLSTIAAQIIEKFLQSNDYKVLQAFSGELFRTRFASRLWMRRFLTAINNQALLEIGCATLRLPVMKKFAEHVFFGRGSFPDDVELASVELQKTFEIP